MILLFVLMFFVLPYTLDDYWLGNANMIGYTILGALGVQLLIGFCGQVTLGHAAFIAVGAYTSTLLILNVPWPQVMLDLGIAYPISIVAAAFVAGLWSVLFGLPSAKVKGFYLILTTMAAQFITVDFIITQYVSQIGGRGQAFSLPPGTIKIGPWIIDSDVKVYYLMCVLVILCTVGVANLLRTKVGRAWVAIRDNDIAAEAMGINIVLYKLSAFFVAGFIGGVAGSFWISNLAAISPEHFPWFWSALAGGRYSDRRRRFDSRRDFRFHFYGGGHGDAQSRGHVHGRHLSRSSHEISIYQGSGVWFGHLRISHVRTIRAGVPLVANEKLF